MRRAISCIVSLSAFAFGLAAWFAAPAAAAEAEEQQPYVCHHTYALCIAASCDPSTHECGRCEATDGSCGYCYVFDGESYSYGKPCDQLAPSGDTVYSTYSDVLSSEYGFRVLSCPSPEHTADCMDAKCTLTGKKVPLTNSDGEVHEIPTAICECEISCGGANLTLGGRCNESNCSSVWSTAGGVLENLPPSSWCDGSGAAAAPGSSRE